MNEEMDFLFSQATTHKHDTHFKTSIIQTAVLEAYIGPLIVLEYLMNTTKNVFWRTNIAKAEYFGENKSVIMDVIFIYEVEFQQNYINVIFVKDVT